MVQDLSFDRHLAPFSITKRETGFLTIDVGFYAKFLPETRFLPQLLTLLQYLSLDAESKPKTRFLTPVQEIAF